MLLIWNREADLKNLVSPTLGRIRDEFNAEVRTGDHTQDGFMWIRSPGWQLEDTATPMSPVDVTPTLFGILNVPAEDFDGRSRLRPSRKAVS